MKYEEVPGRERWLQIRLAELLQYKPSIGYPFVPEETYPVSDPILQRHNTKYARHKSTLNLDLPYNRLPYRRFLLHMQRRRRRRLRCRRRQTVSTSIQQRVRFCAQQAKTAERAKGDRRSSFCSFLRSTHKKKIRPFVALRRLPQRTRLFTMTDEGY